MKTKFNFKSILSAISSAFKQFPVEMGIIILSFLLSMLNLHRVILLQWDDFILLPIFFSIAYALNNIFVKPTKKRIIYYLSWLPLPFLWWLCSPESWMDHIDITILLSCSLLIIFACRRVKDNKQFAVESMRYVLNVFVSLVFAGVAHLLIVGIYYSTIYIFDLGYNVIPDFHESLVLFIYVLCYPTMVLAFTQNNVIKERAYTPSKFLDILLNFIITPAILIYTVILYAYFLKIAFTWSLPQGYLSYMIFGFIMVAMLAKAMQPLLERRYYDWFYNRLSLISIPALIMFWIGVTYRVNEYGLTEDRVYLLLCGLMMTATLVMFICKSRGRYIWVLYMIIALLLAFTYIPPISSKNIALCSQKARVHRLATGLNMLNEKGDFITDAESRHKFSPEDSVSQAKMYLLEESLSYLFANGDYDTFLGLESSYQFSELYEYSIQGYEWAKSDYNNYVYLYNSNIGKIDIKEYQTFSPISNYRNNDDVGEGYYCKDEGDTIKIYKTLVTALVAEQGVESNSCTEELIFEISYTDLLSHQIAKIGYSLDNMPTEEVIKSHEKALLVYRTDKIIVVLEHLQFTLGKTPTIRGVDLEYIFLK